MPQPQTNLLSDENGLVKFAVVAAPKLCGPDERLDDLLEFYRHCVFEGVTRVFVLGPLFDGRGIVNQGQRLRYLVDKFPQCQGVETHVLRHPLSRSSCVVETAMCAAGRSDWVDFVDPVVWLQRSHTDAAVPLVLVYDEGHGFDLSRRRGLAQLLDGPEQNLVAVFGGRRYPDTIWRNNQLLVGVGLFNGAEGCDPVGGTIFSLQIENPTGSVVGTCYPTDFWDFNGTELRRLDDCA